MSANIYEDLDNILRKIINFSLPWKEKRDLIKEHVDGIILNEFLEWFSEENANDTKTPN